MAELKGGSTVAGYMIYHSGNMKEATQSVKGFLSATDKTKLDGIADSANNYVHPANHAATVITEDTTHRFITDAERTAWNAKFDKAGGTVTGTTTFDAGESTTVNIVCDDAGEAVLNVMGSSQGTGRIFVGQSDQYGGGIEYNGDETPTSTGAGSDYITLYRKNIGVMEWTARNYASSNDWEFRGNVTWAGGGSLESNAAYDHAVSPHNYMPLTGGTFTGTAYYEEGGSIVIKNPNNALATYSINWSNDSPRIIIDGSGTGSTGTFKIQGASSFDRMTLDASGNAVFAGDLEAENITVRGNLTVQGMTTIVNSETIALADNIIVLNSNYTGSAPTENAGIEIERGTLANTSIIWNETTNVWQLTNDGSTYENIATQDYVGDFYLPLIGGTLSDTLTVNGSTLKGNTDLTTRLQDVNILPTGYVEDKATNFRFDANCIPFVDKWSGVTVTAADFSAAELTSLFSMFRSSNFVNLNGKTDPCSIEITGLNIATSANTQFYPYVMMHQSLAVTVKMEVQKAGGAWEELYNGTMSSFKIAKVSSTAGNLTGVRYTFSGFTGTATYLRNIGVISRNDYAYAWTVKRDGDSMFGDLNMNDNDFTNVNTISGVSQINGKFGTIVKSTDEWLRINDDSSHTSGIYFGSSVVRTDGTLQVGSGGATFNCNTTTFTYKGNAIYHAGNLLDATQSVAGKMSATDKTKLDNIDVAPAAPTGLSLTEINDTIQISFSQSATSGVDEYQIWRSILGSTSGFNLVSIIKTDEILASMTIIDDSVPILGTVYYQVFAIRNGKMSSALAGNTTTTNGIVDVTDLSVDEYVDSYKIKFDIPDDSRLAYVEIKVDKQLVSGDLLEANAISCYQGLSTEFMYKIPDGDLTKYHQFWVYTVARS